MNGFELIAMPRRAGLKDDGPTEIEVLARVQAPDIPESDEVDRRHGLNIAFVIDRSGSMEGGPLFEAIRCVGAMADRLRSDDRAALVVYDQDVDVLMPSLPLGDRRTLHRELARVGVGGTTNLHGGWLKGAQLLADTLDKQELARVVLLSDGRANEGITDEHTITSQCAALADAGVSTSTYGLGGAFNEGLMIAMGRAGRGSHYYGETADDLMEPFVQEFDLLENLCARDVRLSARAPNGVEADMVSDLFALGPDEWRLPDLPYGGEGWAVLRLLVSKETHSEVDTNGHLTVLELSASFEDMEGERHELPKAFVTLPVLPADAVAALEENELVRDRVFELRAADYQQRAAEAAKLRDWGQVDSLLNQAEMDARDNPWVAEVLTNLRRIAARREERLFSKEALYSVGSFRGRVADKYEQSYDANKDVEASKKSYLRRKRGQGKAEWRDGR